MFHTHEIYLYIYVTCIYTYTYICVYVYIYVICTSIHIHIHTHTYIHIHIFFMVCESLKNNTLDSNTMQSKECLFPHAGTQFHWDGRTTTEFTDSVLKPKRGAFGKGR